MEGSCPFASRAQRSAPIDAGAAGQRLGCKMRFIVGADAIATAVCT
jgi:hypothetical protein